MHRFPPPVTDPAEHIRAAREGRYQDLVLWYCPLIISIIEKYWGDKDEMLSIAFEALCRAARKWNFEDPRAERYGFRVYAETAVRNSLKKYFNQVARDWKYKRYLCELVIKGRQGEKWLTYEELIPDLTPSPAVQVAEALDVSDALPPIGSWKPRARKAGPTLINRIADFLERQPATVPQLADHTGATPGGVRTQVRQLVMNGEAIPIGKLPTGRGLPMVVYARK